MDTPVFFKCYNLLLAAKWKRELHKLGIKQFTTTWAKLLPTWSKYCFIYLFL